MNEIFKGMDNAAEQINENFKTKDVSDQFTITDDSVDSLRAYRFGNVVSVSIEATGVEGDVWTTLAETNLIPMVQQSLSVYIPGGRFHIDKTTTGAYTTSGLIRVFPKEELGTVYVSTTVIVQ